MHLKMKPLWACIWCRFTSPTYVGGHSSLLSFCFLVYLKTKNTSLYFYFPATSQNGQIVRSATTGGSTVCTAQKTTATPGVSALPPGRRPCLPRAQSAGHDAGQHFVRRVWFYCEVNCMNRVTNETKKCLLEIDTTLSSSKATGRDWEASCAGLSSGHKGSSLMGQVLGVLCDHLSPF